MEKHLEGQDKQSEILSIKRLEKKAPKYLSDKYKEWIESEKDKIIETITSANKSKEILGFGDVSFAEFIKVEIDIEWDQSKANAFISARKEAEDALIAQKYFLDEDQLLAAMSKEPRIELINKIATRINFFQKIEDPIVPKC